MGVASSSALDNGSLRWPSSPTSLTLTYLLDVFQRLLSRYLQLYPKGDGVGQNSVDRTLASSVSGPQSHSQDHKETKIETDMPMSPNWATAFSKVRS